MAAARAALDEEHGMVMVKDVQDHNSYFAGRVHEHNVVIACLPAGVDGTAAAASVAKDMVRTFKALRFGLMVGIGGGIPDLDKDKDIRLGDVVVSQPMGTNGGVIHYDKGKSLEGGKFQQKGSLNAPPSVLLTALNALQADHELEDSKMSTYLIEMFKRRPKMRATGYAFPGTDKDCLYQANYPHSIGSDTCDQCDKAHELHRRSRSSTEPQVHYGIIASGNQVVKDTAVRDLLRDDYGALCVEMEAAGLMNNFPCLIIRGICDYADSHKNNAWHRYAAATAAVYAKELLIYVSAEQISNEKPINQVLDIVKGHIEAATDHYRRQEIQYQNEKDRKCHLAFKLDSYEQQKNIHPDRATADPGCGKSVLSRSLIDQELQNTNTHRVCYFFFKDNEKQDKLSIGLCALLHQLFDSQPRLLRHAATAYEKNDHKLSQEEGELWRIFLAATADPEARNVTCVLDALDECREDDRRRLINMLSQFYVNSASSRRRKNWLKFLVTSRPYDDIQRRFQEMMSSLPAIRLRGENENEQIRKEIDMVIRGRVSELAVTLELKKETRNRLEQRLLQMEHRTYLWLHLAIDHVYETYRSSLRPDDESIESVPSSVEAAYEKILEKVTGKVKEAVKTILQIVVGARRPLNTGEMALALDMATLSHVGSAADFRIDKDHLERNIRNWCGLFIFINHSKIYLIHQTARDFLICEITMARNTGWKHRFDRIGTETLMTRICVKYLLLKDLKENVSYDRITDSRNEIEGKSNKGDMKKFLSYSAEHWPGHLRSSEIKENDSFITTLLQLYDTTSERFELWFRLFWATTRSHGFQPEMNELRLAAFNGHDMVLPEILIDKDNVNLGDQEGRTAILWASVGGHEKVVQMLLDKNADVNAQGGHYGNALQAASVGGHEKIVQIMLDKNADVNAQGGYYDNALQAASVGGHEKVVQMLLDKNADVNAQGGGYGNALQAASAEGHEKVVQMLLDKNADVNAQGGGYGNALQAASAEGHEKVVQMLLDRGAKVNAQGGRYGNALKAASVGGFEKVVQMLLDKYANVNAQREDYSNALQAASRGGHENIVQMLVNKNVGMNAQDQVYGNALQAALSRGHKKVVEMILDKAAAVNAQGERCNNALQATSSGGYTKAVQMLGKGAEVNARGWNQTHKHEISLDVYVDREKLSTYSHSDEVWHLEFSHDGTKLATASKDQTVLIYETATFTILHRLTRHEGGVTYVTWSPDDSKLISTDEKAHVWEVPTGRCLRTLDCFGHRVSSASWAPDGHSFITSTFGGASSICHWSARPSDLGQNLNTIGGLGARHCAITPDGERIVVAGERHLYVYNVHTYEKEYSQKFPAQLTCVSVTRDSNNMLVNLAIGGAKLLDIETGNTIRTFEGATQGNYMIRSCFGGSAENFVVSGSEDSMIYVWHKDNGCLIQKLRGHAYCVNAVAWNPGDPGMFASAGDDCRVRIWSCSFSANDAVPSSEKRPASSKSMGRSKAPSNLEKSKPSAADGGYSGLRDVPEELPLFIDPSRVAALYSAWYFPVSLGSTDALRNQIFVKAVTSNPDPDSPIVKRTHVIRRRRFFEPVPVDLGRFWDNDDDDSSGGPDDDSDVEIVGVRAIEGPGAAAGNPIVIQ
ncbi:hypothetical protein EPUS_06267 [Endocarpon pusillum Z07020]|uniref:Nucleoside phosphorylase domain-containing protein n=1 Tax=Endocarpon pusillum (strain Z07020 / HMAS-L-300199) TaxID=1263415 RepID=U1G9Y6_ENDPU|nr:uncharacterized protein EPUS_06267 [Endocarpon pusillum Z07020]ERF68823.1 hypothetical protein EPUS_06267 [Endocarpon pusillum Z07020]